MGPEAAGRTSTGTNELWETKFLGHMRLQKLHDAILPPAEGGVAQNKLSAEKNAEAYAELCLSLDDRSFSLIIRDAKNNGRKALEILQNTTFPQARHALSDFSRN